MGLNMNVINDSAENEQQSENIDPLNALEDFVIDEYDPNEPQTYDNDYGEYQQLVTQEIEVEAVPDEPIPPMGSNDEVKIENDLSGAEYVLTKIQLCDSFYDEPICKTFCPLAYANANGEFGCLHSEIKTEDDYYKCMKLIKEYKNGATNQAKLLELFPEFQEEYLTEKGKAWIMEKFKEV